MKCINCSAELTNEQFCPYCGTKVVNMNVKEVEIIVNPQDINNVVGYKRENINKLKEMYDVDVKVTQDIKCTPNKIDVKPIKKFKEFKDDDINLVTK